MSNGPLQPSQANDIVPVTNNQSFQMDCEDNGEPHVVQVIMFSPGRLSDSKTIPTQSISITLSCKYSSTNLCFNHFYTKLF